MGDVFFRQQRADLLHALFISPPAVIEADTEPGEFMGQECPRHADIRPPAGNGIEHRDFAGEFERVVECRQHRAGDQARLFRALRRRRQENDGVGTVTAIGMEIMLDGADMRVAVLIAQVDKAQRFFPVIPPGFFRRPHIGEKADPEFHNASLFFIPFQCRIVRRNSGFVAPHTRIRLARLWSSRPVV